MASGACRRATRFTPQPGVGFSHGHSRYRQQAPTSLALRRVGIDTCRENLAYMHRDCAIYRAEGFQALSKVEIHANGRHILATPSPRRREPPTAWKYWRRWSCASNVRGGAGFVTGIDTLQIARMARLAGAPKVSSADVDLLHKVGQPVARRDLLYRVHACYPADLAFARAACAHSTGYTVGDAVQVPNVIVEFERNPLHALVL